MEKEGEQNDPSLIALHSCSEHLLFHSEISVTNLQSMLFPISPRKSYSAESYLSSNYLKRTSRCEHDLLSETKSAEILKSRDSKELFSRELTSFEPLGQPPRWPTECQVLDERIKHILYKPCVPEPYYIPLGNEVQPKPIGEEAGLIVYQYYPISAVNYVRSSVGGSQYLLPTCPTPEEQSLRFESRFESGNLAKAIKITNNYYELYIRTDLYTNRHMQWYYFRVTNMRKNILYRFSIVNFIKEDSLYSQGMKPLMYSVRDAEINSIGWRRCGQNIAYFSNENVTPEEPDAMQFYTLTFTLEFPHDEDIVYLANCYPYTYSDLQDYLLNIASHPIKSTFTTLRLLCKTLAGNNVYYVTVTTPPTDENNNKKKKAVVITARVHPGETPSSWMMHGIMDFLTSDNCAAKELRDNFIFKLVPMLNPDGVIVGNNRCSLTGKDLNRQYRTVIRETYPSIWYTKLMIRRLMEECGVAMYCDLHAHSKKHNIFVFGCESRKGVEKKLHEQVFPLMLHKNAAEKFSFENCKFRIQKCKEGTGRVVMWMMGIANSFTMEASFGGSTLNGRNETHFNTADFEQMGRIFCQTLLDFYDGDPKKERLRLKILNRLLKGGSNADEPANIRLSDYSSDGGDTTPSSSDIEELVDAKQPARIVPVQASVQTVPPTPNKPKKIRPKIPKYHLKSPTRKSIQVCKARFDFSWTRNNNNSSVSSDTSSSSDSEVNDTAKNRAKLARKKKKRKKKKPIKKQEITTELDLLNKEYSIIELLPDGRLTTTTTNKRPSPNINVNSKYLADLKRPTHQRIDDIHLKLQTLKNKLWFGIGDVDTHRPITWAASTNPINKFTDSKSMRKKSADKKKGFKKSKTKDEPPKNIKKPKEVMKRQPALELTPLIKTSKVRRSKSLTETLTKETKPVTQKTLKHVNLKNFEPPEGLIETTIATAKKKNKKNKFIKTAKIQ